MRRYKLVLSVADDGITVTAVEPVGFDPIPVAHILILAEFLTANGVSVESWLDREETASGLPGAP